MGCGLVGGEHAKPPVIPAVGRSRKPAGIEPQQIPEANWELTAGRQILYVPASRKALGRHAWRWIVTLALLTAMMMSAAGELPVDAPIVPNAVQLDEPGRYRSPRSYDDTLEFYKRTFRNGGVRWYNIVNLPGIKAKHIASLRKKTKWEGINIYETRGEVRLYVIPRDTSSANAPPAKK